MKLERKIIPFQIQESKEVVKNGTNLGIIEGYAATYDRDRGGDVIVPGAFKKSLKKFKKDNRPIRMFFQHSYIDVIGGFPIETVEENEKGLFVRGEINLDVQKGREAYSLAKQGVLSDFSIGYTIEDWAHNKVENERILKEVTLWEISMVTEPMNQNARITDVKSVTPFLDLPLADQDMEWDSTTAIERVRDFTGSEDSPSDAYRRAFFWFDSENADNFTAYKLPYADVVSGKLKAIPRGIFAVAGVLRGARGGVDIPVEDKTKIANVVNKYYDKMGLESPLKSKNYFPEITCMGDIEDLLKDTGYSNSQRKILISKIKEFSVSNREDCDNKKADDRDAHSEANVNLIQKKIDELIKNLK